MSDKPSPHPGTPGPLTIPQRLALAIQHHRAGRLADAEVLYRGILHQVPQHPDALQLLGTLAHQAGRHQVAVNLIRQALALHGPNAMWHSNLAAACLGAGQLDEAETHSREALRLEPTLPDAHHNLGLALLSKGRLGEAESAFRETLRLRPGHVDTRVYLGTLLHRQGRLAEAVPLLTEAIRLAPNHFLARLGLAEALRELRQPAAAEPHYREAVRLGPGVAAAHYGLGLALRDQSRTREAEECLRETLRLQPQFPDARTNLGLLLLSQGRSDEARTAFQEELRLDPNHAWAFSGLSRMAVAGRYSFNDEEVARIEALASQSGRPIQERSGLFFALARIRERAGEYAQAFAHYRQANELLKAYLQARGAAYDPAQYRRFVDRLIAVLTPTYFERVRSFGVDSDVPVFVVGMPRSGTTLAEQVLASHPRVHGAGELHDIEHLVLRLGRHLGRADEYPNSLERFDPATARTLAEEYLRSLRQRGGESARVVDKMPLNYQHLGVIATLFPRARVVHCRRDPIDTCLSCYFQDFMHPLPFGPDLNHLGRHYREYERLMAHQARVLPLPSFELRYEELMENQEEVSRRLVAFCGLDWDERCLRFHETDRPVNTSNALQVRQPLYRSSVGRWKRYQEYLGPLLEALGYDGQGRSHPYINTEGEGELPGEPR
jgi:tetratricopeptide (TPR) repeat protein